MQQQKKKSVNKVQVIRITLYVYTSDILLVYIYILYSNSTYSSIHVNLDVNIFAATYSTMSLFSRSFRFRQVRKLIISKLVNYDDSRVVMWATKTVRALYK